MKELQLRTSCHIHVDEVAIGAQFWLFWFSVNVQVISTHTRMETVCAANQNRHPVAMAQMKTYLKHETLDGELKKHTCRLHHGFD